MDRGQQHVVFDVEDARGVVGALDVVAERQEVECVAYMIMGKYIKDSEIKEIEEEYKRQIINTLSKEIKGVESQLSIGTNAKTNNLLRGKIFAYKHAIDIVYNLKKD